MAIIWIWLIFVSIAVPTAILTRLIAPIAERRIKKKVAEQAYHREAGKTVYRPSYEMERYDPNCTRSWEEQPD